MMKLLLIGIGTGNPDHITMQGARALASADLVLIPDKGDEKQDLAHLRHALCDRYAPTIARATFAMPRRDDGGDYEGRVRGWHDAIACGWHDAIAHDQARVIGAGDLTVAMLVWGDPSLYDSTLRIARKLDPTPRIEVIPGVTALQALTAAHATTLNTLGGAVCVTTGRRLRNHGWPSDVDSVAVMLDAQCSFQSLDQAGATIWWGAFLGMPQQILEHGALDQVGPRIVTRRAQARADHGWIMDIYLLRRGRA